jgi:hypothetical protein
MQIKGTESTNNTKTGQVSSKNKSFAKSLNKEDPYEKGKKPATIKDLDKLETEFLALLKRHKEELDNVTQKTVEDIKEKANKIETLVYAVMIGGFIAFIIGFCALVKDSISDKDILSQYNNAVSTYRDSYIQQYEQILNYQIQIKTQDLKLSELNIKLATICKKIKCE